MAKVTIQLFTKKEANEHAMHACQLLVSAYNRAEESESIDWDDIDMAYEIAMVALRPTIKRGKA